MQQLIENLLNGNLTAAKIQATRHSVESMKAYMMNELGWDALKAFRACRYLKFPSQETFDLWCQCD